MTAIGDIDVGNPEIDRDHQALAQLVERAGNVCRGSARPHGNCDQCPAGKPKACLDAVMEIADQMMVLMLDHFQREDILMSSLPASRPVNAHCEAHRREHVNFSTRYNRMVARIDVRQPVIGVSALHDFIIEWIRRHVLEYEMELAALLKAASPSR